MIIPDVTDRASAYARIDESGNVTKQKHHQTGRVWATMLSRGTSHRHGGVQQYL